jgi:Cytochrome C'
MLRSLALLGFLGAQAGVFLIGPSLVVADTPKDPPPFLKVMEDNFSGKKNVHRNLKKAVEADTTDWGEVATLMKQYSIAAGFVGQHAKTKPEKGDEKSWSKLTVQFAAEAKELDGAVAKKDKDKAIASLEKLHETCEACHENHR